MSKQKGKQHRLSDMEKIVVVRLIKEKKDVLFGRFSAGDGITLDSKRKGWNDTIEQCKKEYDFDAGIFVTRRKILRTCVIMYGVKDQTLKKRDRLNATGSQGEEYSKLEECVLDALGANAELVQGLPVREQWGDDVAPTAVQGSSRQSARSSSSLSHRSSWLVSVASSRCSSPVGDRDSPVHFIDSRNDDVQNDDFALDDLEDSQPSTSRAAAIARRPTKRCLDPIASEKLKQIKLKTDIMYLQKQNLILQNKKLEIEIDQLKRV